jgi:uncharacterized caspase-like protein
LVELALISKAEVLAVLDVQRLLRTKPPCVVLVMDACHSGFTETSAKGMGRVGNFNADELAQGSGQLVICSSEPAEQAWESTRYENGVFTKKLLEGLKSKGPNTTVIEAYNATKRGVTDEVREDRAGVRQTDTGAEGQMERQ